MKKTIKIIMLIICLAFFCGVAILCMNVINSYKKYTCTITGINGNIVTGAFLELSKSSFNSNQRIIKDSYGNTIDISKINVGDTIYVYNSTEHINNSCEVTNIENDIITVEQPQLFYYSFDAKETVIKDKEGSKINVSKLNIGDRISIINKKENIIIPDIIKNSQVHNLSNIIQVKIIDDNIREREAIKNKNMVATKSAIVIRTNEDSIDVMGKEDTTDVFKIKYTNEGNIGFKQGQEILIYFNGYIKSSVPKEIENVEKIEIIKNKSDIPISQEILKKVYNSPDNIEIDVTTLSKTGITMIIKDFNDLQYNYSNNYTLLKKETKLTQTTKDDKSISIRRYVCRLERSCKNFGYRKY